MYVRGPSSRFPNPINTRMECKPHCVFCFSLAIQRNAMSSCREGDSHTSIHRGERGGERIGRRHRRIRRKKKKRESDNGCRQVKVGSLATVFVVVFGFFVFFCFLCCLFFLVC